MTDRAPGARRCGVLGHPIDHSLSPLLHRTAYAELGLDWTYDAHDVSADALPGFLDGLDPSWRGLSLTMPLKRAVLPLLDDLDDTAQAVGAVNTVLLDGDGRHGANTDVPGLVTALRAAAPAGAVPARGTVVGGGATAASALAALAALGCADVEVRVREPLRAEETLRTGRALGLAVRVARLDAAWSGTLRRPGVHRAVRGGGPAGAGRRAGRRGRRRRGLRPVALAAAGPGGTGGRPYGHRPRPAGAPGGRAGAADVRPAGASRHRCSPPRSRLWTIGQGTGPTGGYPPGS